MRIQDESRECGECGKPAHLCKGHPDGLPIGIGHNNTPYRWEEIASMTLLGTTVNKWRQRRIALYQHPHRADCVVSVGITFDGKMTVACVEDKNGWTTALDYAALGKVYTSE